MARQEIINGISYDEGFNRANNNFIELYNQNIALEGQIENLNLQVFKMANNYRLPSDMPTSFQVGRTLFYADGAEWKASTGLSSAMIVETIVINGYYSIQYISGYNSSPLLYRICLSNNAWGPWREIVTTTQPNWIAATLQNGWTGNLWYRKNQIGQLEIMGTIVPGTKTFGTVLAQLPVGYRVVSNVSLLAFTSGGVTLTGIAIWTDGNIRIYPTASDSSSGEPWYINSVINSNV